METVEYKIKLSVPGDTSIGCLISLIRDAIKDKFDKSEKIKVEVERINVKIRFKIYEDTQADGRKNFLVYHDGEFISNHMPGDIRIREMMKRNDVEWHRGLDMRTEAGEYLIEKWGLV